MKNIAFQQENIEHKEHTFIDIKNIKQLLISSALTWWQQEQHKLHLCFVHIFRRFFFEK